MAPSDWTKFYHEEVEAQMSSWIGICVVFLLLSIIEWAFCLYAFNIDLIRPFSDLGIYFILLNTLFSLSFWYFIYRRISKFKNDEGGIIIALTKYDKNVDTELKKLFNKIEDVISRQKLKYIISVKIFPDRLIPKNELRAHRLRDKFNAKLIIWGNVDHGSIDSVSHTRFVPINFSYKVGLPPNQTKSLGSVIKSALAHRKWIISENNSLIDREYLASNLEEVSLYIIGIVLFFANRGEESMEVLKIVLAKYESRVMHTDDDKITIEHIKLIVDVILRKIVSRLNLWPSSSHLSDNILKAQEIISVQNELGFLYSAELIKAQIEFANGNLVESKKCIDRAYKINPADSASYFSFAFLYFNEGNLKQGWYWLNKALKSSNLWVAKQQMISVVIWYQNLLDENRGKSYLYFPMARIYSSYGDKKLALEFFNKFIRRYSIDSNKIIKRMIKCAEREIRKLKRS